MDTQTMNVEIGRRIAEIRKSASEKQETTAQYLNMVRSNYTKKELGQSAFSPYELAKLAEHFGVDCHYLITGIKAANEDMHSSTGLSEKAINKLCWFKEHDSSDEGFVNALDGFISSDGFTELIGCISIYISTRQSTISRLNKYISNLGLYEDEEIQNFWHKLGLSVFRPNQIDTLWLNNARDTFTEILKNELVEGGPDDGEH